MAKHVVDIDEAAPSAAQAELGTATMDETVNEALRRAGAGRDRRVRQLREVGHDLLGGHARGEVVEDAVDGDPGASEARLPAPHARTHLDRRPDGHDASVPPGPLAGPRPP